MNYPPAPKEIPESVRRAADFEYDEQKLLFERHGRILPVFRGHKSGGAVVDIPYNGEWRDQAAKLVPKMLAKYPIVTGASEVWQRLLNANSDGYGARTEGVMINVYTRHGTWTMMCPILRSPDRLEKGQLWLPDQMEGRASTGALTAKDLKKFTAGVVETLTLKDDLAWKPRLSLALIRVYGDLGDITPFTNALFSPGIPPDRLDYGHRLVERYMGWELLEPREAPAEADAQAACLLGINFLLRDGASPEKAVTEAYAALLRATATLQDPIALDPQHGLSMPMLYVPLSVSGALASFGLRWLKDESPSARHEQQVRDWARQRFEEQVERLARERLATQMVITVPAIAKLHVLASEKPSFGLPLAPPPASAAGLHQRLRAAIAQALPTDGSIELQDVDDFYDALRAKYSRHLRFEASSRVAEFSAAFDGRSPADLHVIVAGCVTTETPGAGIFSSAYYDDSPASPFFSLQALPLQPVEASIDQVVQALRDAGVTRIDRQQTRHEPDIPTDSLGAPMVPGPNGTWFSAFSRMAPEALGVLQSVEWAFQPSEEQSDPEVLKLPLPHLLVRLGLVNSISSRYTPEAYRAVRDALSRADRNMEQVWADACVAHQGLGSLTAKFPMLARPDELIRLTLQLHWSRSPTMTIRPALTQRLRLTDIGSKLPMRMVKTPFPLQYVHFGDAEPLAEVTLTEDGREASYRPTGAFVHRAAQGTEEIGLWLVWQTPGRPLDAHIYATTLQAYGDQSVDDAIAAALADEEDPEMRASARLVVEEVLKLMFYATSRDARMVERNERGQMMLGMGKKSPEQKARIMQRAKGLYDHILVGPEQALQVTSEGLESRQMPVHVRRGHLHGYWTGKGRTSYIVKFLEPVVVNQQRLGDDDAAPRDYDLR